MRDTREPPLRCGGPVRQSDMLDAPEAERPAAAVGSPTRRLTAGLMLGVGVHAMEGFSVYTALPALTTELDARPLYGAVITTYMLASLVGLVWAGVRTDVHGPSATLRVGLASVALGLAGATLAPTVEVLLAFRCFQGFGGGALTTVIYAAVHQAYPRERWAQTLAFLSLAWGVSAVAMPGLLGLIVDHLHWRLVFALGLPVAGLAALLILPALAQLAAQPASVAAHADRSERATRRSPRALALSLSAVVVGGALVLHGTALSSLPPVATLLVLLGAAAAVLVGLVRLWPAGVLTLRAGLPAAVGVKALACALFFGSEAHLPLAITDVHQRGSTFVGFVLTAAAMAWSSAAFLQARLLPRLGPARVTVLGVVAIGLGVGGLLLLLVPGTSPYLALPLWALSSAGMGFVYNTTSDSALAATCEGDSGATGTALGISDSVGAAFGAGLASALLNNAAPRLTEGLAHGWLALLALALPMALGASRLGGPATLTSRDAAAGPPGPTP